MNSRERMRVAMRKGIPDRVPAMCQLAFGHYALHSGEDPVAAWHDTETFARAQVALQRRYRFDGILVNMPGRDPDWRRQVASIEAAGAGQRVRWRDGGQTVFPGDDSPHALLADGQRPRLPFEQLDPASLFYVEPHAQGGMRCLRSFPPWQAATLQRVRELTGGEVSVHAEVFSPFSQLMELGDHEGTLMALILEPKKVLAALDRLADGTAVLAGLYADAGCDALLISSAFVGAGFISRRHYATFELPFLQRIVSYTKARRPDLPVYVHTCGAIGDRLDLMEQAGIDGIDTLDPPPLGTVELGAAIERLGKRLFLKGNLDPIRDVLECSPAATRAAAEARLGVAGPGGAYILSTACSVPPHANPANILELTAAAEAWRG